MTSHSTISDPIDQWLKTHASAKKYFINQIPLGLLCADNSNNNHPLLTNSQDSLTNIMNPNLGQVILPNSSWGCRLCNLTFASVNEHYEHYKSLEHLTQLRSSLNHENQGDNNDNDNDDSDEKNENDDNESEDNSSDDNENNNENVDSPMSGGSKPSITQFQDEYPEGSVRKMYTNQTGTQYIFHPINSIWEYRISDMIYCFPSSADQHNSMTSSTQINPWTILSQTFTYFHQKNHYICILILRSGKFAASVFDTTTGKSIIHKVFRRYTVRAKAGGSQSSHDSKGRKAQSIGSQLRRYGEQALREDIYKLLLSWKEFINNCSAIFMSIPKTMRSYIFHNDLPQDRDYPLKTIDSRVKFISFQVKKPVFEELCLVYEKCLMINFGIFSSTPTETAGEGDGVVSRGDGAELSNPSQESKSNNNKDDHNEDEDEEKLEFHLEEEMIRLQAACERGDFEQTKQLLVELTNSSNKNHLNDPISIETLMTLLHIVSERGYQRLVTLLLESGASPEVKDIRNRTPYQLSKDKETRDAFRRYRGVAEQEWDWDSCGVPSALTEETIRNQKEKEKEKKKRLKQRKKEEKLNKQQGTHEGEGGEGQEEAGEGVGEGEGSREEEQKGMKMKMSVSEEITLLERRAREEAGVCSYCQVSLYGRLPTYDIYDKRCCSSVCVVAMRRKLAAEAAEKRIGGK